MQGTSSGFRATEIAWRIGKSTMYFELFASLECERIDRRRFATRTEARLALFQYIEGFYNTRRRHASLGYLSPVNYKRSFKKTA